MSRAHLLSLFSLITLAACTTKETIVATDGRTGPTYQGPSEVTQCTTTNSGDFTNSIAINGRAYFNKRETFDTFSFSGLGSADPAAGSHPAGVYNIRRAEVRVTDANGTLRGCGETLNDGTFTIWIERNIGATYTLSVNSRSYGNYLNASVLNRPESNTYYSITTTFSASATIPAPGLTLTAAADGQILGGAFNILDQMLNAADFLRTYTSTCAGQGCVNTNTSPLRKVTAYWERGFNPNDYFGSTAGLSFYLPGYYRLFILGGISGNTESADTDHFDDSVIIHEFGHFLEDAVFASDSPGGSHDGDGVIDPRLALSEGWGNFIQAAVLGTNNYVDTIGNKDGSTGIMIDFNLETASSGKDLPLNAGEGNFRELAVSRLMLDLVDTNADSANSATDNRSNEFATLWGALTKTTHGLADTKFAFRSIGHVHLAQAWLQANAGASDWSSVRQVNFQDGNTSQYAQLVSPGACTSTGVPNGDYSVDPNNTADSGSSYSGSHLLLNNDFYHLKIESAGTLTPGSYTLQLRYQDADGLNVEADLDLYLYNSDARFAVSSDIVASGRAEPDGTPGTAETETVTASLSSGDYLINMNAYTGSGTGGTDRGLAGATGYELWIKKGSGAFVKLCPADLLQ